MSSGKHILCGPCQEENVNTKADIWCYNCEEGLCSTCSGHHKRSKLSRDHKTIDIIILKPSIHAITTKCHKHAQQLILYCPSHLIPCCDECISTTHPKCTGIKSLAGVVEKTKIEKSKESLDKDMNSIILTLNEMLNKKSENIKRGEQQYESIRETVAKFRKKINKHLDYFEKKLYQETDTALNKEKSKASNLISEINEKKKNLKGMKDQLQVITTHYSKLHSFLEVHQIEQQVHQYQQFVEDLKDDDRAKEFEIKFKQNDEIDKTISKLESLKSFGEIFVNENEIAVKREISVRREAYVESREHSNVNNITMYIEKKIEINMKHITDMICLMDGRVIVSQKYDKVNLLTSEGKLEKQFAVPGYAVSVTQINQDTIAIMYQINRVINIFRMQSETVTKVIKLDKVCGGLSFANKSMAVGLDKNEIRIIDLEGYTLKSIPVQSESILDFFVRCNNRVIYSDYTSKAVFCVDESGTQIWEYKQDLSFPKGLCADSFGNIFISDYGSQRIIVISKDGQNSKVLIRKEDGLHFPWCVCFKHNDESSGFICSYFGEYLTKFNMSSR